MANSSPHYRSQAQDVARHGARRMNVGLRRGFDRRRGTCMLNDLMATLGRVRNRFGNTTVNFKGLKWGAAALHAQDDDRKAARSASELARSIGEDAAEIIGDC